MRRRQCRGAHLDQAILPVVPSDFLGLRSCYFVWSRGRVGGRTWHKTAFVGMVTNVECRFSRFR